MREPPPLNESNQQRIGYLVRALLMIVMGVIVEQLFRPVVPWTYVLGPLIAIVGAGIGLGVFERYKPTWAALAYLILSFGIFGYTYLAQTSLLPLFLYSAAYDLTRFGLRVQFDG